VANELGVHILLILFYAFPSSLNIVFQHLYYWSVYINVSPSNTDNYHSTAKFEILFATCSFEIIKKEIDK
jgi:hypothetical protein